MQLITDFEIVDSSVVTKNASVKKVRDLIDDADRLDMPFVVAAEEAFTALHRHVKARLQESRYQGYTPESIGNIIRLPRDVVAVLSEDDETDKAFVQRVDRPTTTVDELRERIDARIDEGRRKQDEGRRKQDEINAERERLEQEHADRIVDEMPEGERQAFADLHRNEIGYTAVTMLQDLSTVELLRQGTVDALGSVLTGDAHLISAPYDPDGYMAGIEDRVLADPRMPEATMHERLPRTTALLRRFHCPKAFERHGDHAALEDLAAVVNALVVADRTSAVVKPLIAANPGDHDTAQS